MKTTHWSLLLAGLASMAVGCQPEEPVQAPGAALESQKAALTAGTWTLNASSLLEHWEGSHTATLLNGPGDVLVADGNGAEVYNPYTNTWRRTASMLTPRNRHTATELPSGKVLVAGGSNSDWPHGLSSAELYDPATGTWSPTGTMDTPRGYPTAVRLDSGRVLVVGGGEYYKDYGPLDPPGEVYDPDTGTWSAVQGTFTPRDGVSATVLYSGKVLVTGGYAWWRTTDQESAEVNLYDPATNSWSRAGNLARARWRHFSVRLYSGKVFIVGGTTGGNTVELYDPYSGQWSLGPPFPYDMTPLFSATMLYSGEVLVTDAIGNAALYDPTTSSWLPTPKMNVGRYFHPTTLLHTGEVLFVGGNSSSPRSVERFTR